ncbi:ComEC/Rec2 family competence protein [Dokdonia sp. Hel_I_53]|uniref:ComEC/Rec2 family competence protein n=1 Tax=Dokdonia sp. Hel_I_53 TaxID=1566287 RepID=UPI001198E587|nr:ComEC/Rec2 family competence protein [Dokdonia sp. Hel_I_53]TVZ53109.1 competence protein ComEC [Dokdonia sp. Hel_I_53]
MKNINFPILNILLAFIAGILIYGRLEHTLLEILLSVIFCFITLVSLHIAAGKLSFSEIPFIIVVLFLFIGLGYLKSYSTDQRVNDRHYLHLLEKHPQRLLFSIKNRLKSSQFQDKYIISVHLIDQEPAIGDLLLSVKKDSVSKKMAVGKWYHAKTLILPLPFQKNPYQFDYGNYLQQRQIYGQLLLSEQELILSNKTSSGFMVSASRFRESVLNKLHSCHFTKSQFAIMDALLLGQRENIDKKLTDDYAAAGMMHILAVSGLHVGIILLILRFLTRFINWYRLRWFRSFLIIISIWCFALVTGLSPSVLRAATMFSFLEIGSSLGGKRKSKDAVLASALFLLVYDPLLIYQVGFQLSYMAVMAILWIQPWLSSFYKPKYYIDKLLWGVATVTISAQLGVVPLSLYYFHQFAGLFFLSNIIVLPFLTLILGYGLLIILIALIGEVPTVFIKTYGWIIDLMNSYIHWIASQDLFVLKHITLGIPLLIASYILIISIIFLLKKYTALRVYIAAFSLMCFTCVLLEEKTRNSPSHLAILHKYKTSTVTVLKGNKLLVFKNDSTESFKPNYIIDAYKDAVTINKLSVHAMSNYYRFNEKEILVVDSLGIYDIPETRPNFILLSNSPKINLRRLILVHPKATIIADGSNYRSYIQKWEKTCLKEKIPFHNTYKKGAFLIK